MNDPNDLTSSYNTALSPQDEQSFQAWRAQLAADPKTSDLANIGDYDLRGAWKANAQSAANGHLPDTWKKPNHITFSDGSIYANAKNPPGKWAQAQGGSWTYQASPSLTRYRDPSDLLNYFQVYEPGNNVVLPNALRSQPPQTAPALNALAGSPR